MNFWIFLLGLETIAVRLRYLKKKDDTAFIGPCPHRKDPWDRCDYCEEAVNEAYNALLKLGCPRHPDVESLIAKAIAKAMEVED